MAKCDPDVISLCHTVDFSEGVKRAGGDKFAYQGNMDAGVLFGDKEHITKRVLETIKTAEDEGVRYDFGFDVCFLRSPARPLARSPARPLSRSLPRPLTDRSVFADRRHIMNLGHGIQQGTPEENVAHLFEVAKSARYGSL